MAGDRRESDGEARRVSAARLYDEVLDVSQYRFASTVLL